MEGSILSKGKLVAAYEGEDKEVMTNKTITSMDEHVLCKHCFKELFSGDWAFICELDKSICCDDENCKKKFCFSWRDHTDFFGELKKVVEVRR